MIESKYPVSYISRLRMGSDGKGIRTLIGFQDCPLRCKYCINPFTWNDSKEVAMMTASDIYDSILIDRPYILATRGGVTFGGGEPLLQHEAIKEFIAINHSRDHFSIYLETSLNVPQQMLDDVIDDIDKYIVDIKAMDSAVYRDYTGGDYDRVIENLKHLIEVRGADCVVVRIPRIPGFTERDDQLRYREELEKLGVRNFDLFDYRVKEIFFGRL